MALRELTTVNYIPLLSVRPAEIKALQELPHRDKDSLFPFMFLRPWATAHHLDSALSRIESAYGSERPIIFDIAPAEAADTNDRPVLHNSSSFVIQPADTETGTLSLLSENTSCRRSS